MHHRSYVWGSASRGVGGLHPGGLHPRWRGSASRERGSAFGGWPDRPSDTWNTTVYGQQAGGTHPTGMHSC